MASMLKAWHQVENLSLSLDAYLVEEQSRQISSMIRFKTMEP